MPKIFQTTIIKRGDVIIVPPVSNGELTEERLTYDNLNKAQKAINTHSAVVAVMDAQKRAIESVTAAFAAELTEPNKDAVESPFVEAMVSDMAQRAFDQTVIAASVAEMGQRADDTIQFIAIPTSDQAKRAVEDINSEVRASALELAKKAIDDIQASILARTEINQKATDEIVIDLVRLEVNQKAVEDVSNTVTATAAEPNQKADDSIEAAIIALPDDTKRADDVGTVIANYTGYANQNVSTTGWVNPANALGDTTGTASTLTAASSGLAGTTSNTTTGTITLGLENPSPLLSDLNISGPVAIEIERQIVGAGTLPLGQSHNIAYEYQIVGAVNGSFGSPTTTPPIAITATQGYRDGCVISGIRLPSLNGTSDVLFVSGFIDTNTATANPHPVPIVNGQAGDLIFLMVGMAAAAGTNDFRNNGFRDEVLAAGYTELYDRTATGGLSSSALFVKTHGGSPETTPTLDTGNWTCTYILFRNAGTPQLLDFFSDEDAYVYPSQSALNAGDMLVIHEGGGSITGAGNAARRGYSSVTPATTGASNNDYNTVGTYAYGTAAHYYSVPIPVAGWLPIASDVGTTGSVAKGFVSANVQINTLADVDNLQVRAVGTVVSGTGLGASKAASVFRARVRLTAQKDY